eukprot:c2696_g1_i1.p1 GENE.c2696_g1_i1~~c2696_g1_i1.p1  ORF type:complete len:125 (-),score=17.69 c2696_g1_i1:142-516(-)
MGHTTPLHTPQPRKILIMTITPSSLNQNFTSSKMVFLSFVFFLVAQFFLFSFLFLLSGLFPRHPSVDMFPSHLFFRVTTKKKQLQTKQKKLNRIPPLSSSSHTHAHTQTHYYYFLLRHAVCVDQ